MERGKHPSGLHYMEKILQLSYRISPISKEKIGSYINSITPKRVVKEDMTETVEPTISKEDASPDTFTPKVNVPQEDPQISAASSEKPTLNSVDSSTKKDDSNINLTAEQIDITEDDRDLMTEVLKEIEISPRAIKRIVNSFKVMKMSLHRQDILRKDDDKAKKLMKACLIILGLSACLDPTVRLAMCDALSNLEKYHMNFDENNTNLYKVLFGNEVNDDSPLKTHTLSRQGLKNVDWSIETWNEAKEYLRLARCFSFVGEM